LAKNRDKVKREKKKKSKNTQEEGLEEKREGFYKKSNRPVLRTSYRSLREILRGKRADRHEKK
jgi:hypothetical protein